MEVPAQLILPSQDYLKQGTVRFILECIKNSDTASLPPAPIVRENAAGDLIAIDGHNLIAVRSYLGQNIEIHLAHSANDGLPGNSEAAAMRNEELASKYESALSEHERIKSQGIHSFDDLIQKYPDLFADVTAAE